VLEVFALMTAREALFRFPVRMFRDIFGKLRSWRRYKMFIKKVKSLLLEAHAENAENPKLSKHSRGETNLNPNGSIFFRQETCLVWEKNST